MSNVHSLPDRKTRWTHERIYEDRLRAEMAANVKLSIDDFLELLDLAEKGLENNK